VDAVQACRGLSWRSASQRASASSRLALPTCTSPCWSRLGGLGVVVGGSEDEDEDEDEDDNEDDADDAGPFATVARPPAAAARGAVAAAAAAVAGPAEGCCDATQCSTQPAKVACTENLAMADGEYSKRLGVAVLRATHTKSTHAYVVPEAAVVAALVAAATLPTAGAAAAAATLG
jgi:hypothetical protein